MGHWGWLHSTSRGTGNSKDKKWLQREHLGTVCVREETAPSKQDCYKHTRWQGERGGGEHNREREDLVCSQENIPNTEPMVRFPVDLLWSIADVAASKLWTPKTRFRMTVEGDDFADQRPKHTELVAHSQTLMAKKWISSNPLCLSVQNHTDVSSLYKVGQVKLHWKPHYSKKVNVKELYVIWALGFGLALCMVTVHN